MAETTEYTGDDHGGEVLDAIRRLGRAMVQVQAHQAQIEERLDRLALAREATARAAAGGPGEVAPELLLPLLDGMEGLLTVLDRAGTAAERAGVPAVVPWWRRLASRLWGRKREDGLAGTARGAGDGTSVPCGDQWRDDLRTGVELLHSQVRHVLASAGYEPIEAEAGGRFDPMRHRALAVRTVSGPVAAELVEEVLLPGWGRPGAGPGAVLRLAQVRVLRVQALASGIEERC